VLSATPDPAAVREPAAADRISARSRLARSRALLPGWRALALPVGLALASLLGLVLLADDHGDFDLQVYAGAMHSWAGGVPLYDYVHPGTAYGFTYPPFAALTMLPLAVVPLGVAHALLLAADAAVITATTWWLAARVAPRYGWSTWYATACAVPLVCLLEPVRDTVGFGQVNLLLVALVVLDLEALRRGSRWAGIGVGLAAAVKLTPAVLVVLLAAHRPRAALNAVAVGALATVAAFVVAPGTSLEFWGSALFDTSRVGRTDFAANQALSGVLARLDDSATRPLVPWLVLVAVVGVVGLRRAVGAVRAGDDLAGLALVGLTGALVSPISWTHHLWWVVPAIAVLLAAGARDRRWLWAAAGVTALFASSLPDLVRTQLGEHLAHGPLVVVGESSYALACLLLVLFLPVRAPAAPVAA
jgi:alpha-1,2-mannosyltransferase